MTNMILFPGDHFQSYLIPHTGRRENLSKRFSYLVIFPCRAVLEIAWQGTGPFIVEPGRWIATHCIISHPIGADSSWQGRSLRGRFAGQRLWGFLGRCTTCQGWGCRGRPFPEVSFGWWSDVSMALELGCYWWRECNTDCSATINDVWSMGGSKNPYVVQSDSCQLPLNHFAEPSFFLIFFDHCPWIWALIVVLVLQ